MSGNNKYLIDGLDVLGDLDKEFAADATKLEIKSNGQKANAAAVDKTTKSVMSFPTNEFLAYVSRPDFMYANFDTERKKADTLLTQYRERLDDLHYLEGKINAQEIVYVYFNEKHRMEALIEDEDKKIVGAINEMPQEKIKVDDGSNVTVECVTKDKDGKIVLGKDVDKIIKAAMKYANKNLPSSHDFNTNMKYGHIKKLFNELPEDIKNLKEESKSLKEEVAEIKAKMLNKGYFEKRAKNKIVEAKAKKMEANDAAVKGAEVLLTEYIQEIEDKLWEKVPTRAYQQYLRAMYGLRKMSEKDFGERQIKFAEYIRDKINNSGGLAEDSKIQIEYDAEGIVDVGNMTKPYGVSNVEIKLVGTQRPVNFNPAELADFRDVVNVIQTYKDLGLDKVKNVE